MNSPLNYGIFGGTFDPVHQGHRILAQRAAESLGLDRLFWIPSWSPPHKRGDRTPFEHRVAMLQTVLAPSPSNEIVTIERELPRPSYSLRTVLWLKERYGSQHRWFLLIGEDNWRTFHSWHRHEDLLREVEILVYPRAGDGSQNPGDGIHMLTLPHLPGSSTAIREALHAGDIEGAITLGLPPELTSYIEQHRLYGC